MRCTNPNTRNYESWGGRGIRVHAEWLDSFEAFFRDVGPAPSPKHSIDRIDNDGHYKPGNVRWATSKEQARNKRGNHRIMFNGRMLTIAEVSEITGIKWHTIARRLKRGWTEADAVRPIKDSAS